MSITIKAVSFQNNEDLVNVLSTIETSGFATLESTTIPKVTVKNRIDKTPFNDVFKGEVFRTKKEYVTMGIDYSNAVNNQRKREGIQETFTAEKTEWYENVNKYIIKHKTSGDYYLRYFLDMNANYKHSQYCWHYADGTELTEQEINILKEGFLPKKSSSTKQETEKEILIRQVKLNSIARIVFNGTEYIRK